MLSRARKIVKPTFECPKCRYVVWPGALIGANRLFCQPPVAVGCPYGITGEHFHVRCPRCYYQATEPLEKESSAC